MCLRNRILQIMLMRWLDEHESNMGVLPHRRRALQLVHTFLESRPRQSPGFCRTWTGAYPSPPLLLTAHPKHLMDTQMDSADIHTVDQLVGFFLSLYFTVLQPDANIKNVLFCHHTTLINPKR